MKKTLKFIGVKTDESSIFGKKLLYGSELKMFLSLYLNTHMWEK